MNNQYEGYLRQQGLSRTTIKNHITMLNQFKVWAEGENITPEQITHNELLTYIQYHQSKGNKQVSIQRTLNVIKHYFNYWIEQGFRVDNPTEKIKLYGIQRNTIHTLFSQQELESLYNNYPLYESVNSPLQQNRSKRNKVMTGLLIWQGLDSTALKLLTVKHLQLRSGTIDIPGSKRSNPRTLKLEPAQLFDLMDYIQNVLPVLSQQKSDKEQYLFNTHGVQNLHNSLHRMLFQLKKINSNLKTLKQVRANVIIYWLKTNNLRQVQYMAGHKYVSSTEAYQRNDIEDLKQEIVKFHPLGWYMVNNEN